jgi:hypothetical protein
MTRQREQRQDCGRHGDDHRPQAFDSRVANRLLERFAFFAHLFDEIEQHDDMADDHTDETRDPQERHEAERRSHDRQD